MGGGDGGGEVARARYTTHVGKARATQSSNNWTMVLFILSFEQWRSPATEVPRNTYHNPATHP